MNSKLKELMEAVCTLCYVLESIETIITLCNDDLAHDCITKGTLMQNRVYKISELLDAIEALWDHLSYSTAWYDASSHILISNTDVIDLVGDYCTSFHIELCEDGELFIAHRTCSETCATTQIDLELTDHQANRIIEMIGKYPNKVTQ